MAEGSAEKQVRDEMSPPTAARFGLAFHVDKFDCPRTVRRVPLAGSTVEEVFDSDPLTELAADVEDVAAGRRESCEYRINYSVLRATAGGFELRVRWPGSEAYTEMDGSLDDLRALLEEWNEYCASHPAP